LESSPDRLLSFASSSEGKKSTAQDRIAAAAKALTPDDLDRVAIMVDALAQARSRAK
jgi:hypothetical protein